jgi:translation initiation factor 5A
VENLEKKLATMHDLKSGSYVLIDGIPCRVLTVTKSKAGKHGSAKIRIEASGLIDERRRSLLGTSDTRVEVPIIQKRNAQVISISGDKANVMDLESYETFEIDIADEFKAKLQEGSTILYWDIGVKMIKGIK